MLPPNLGSSHPTRRGFIAGAGGLVAAAACPASLARPQAAQPDALIVVFLRGGADGLSLCVPHADPGYTCSRPTIAIPPPGSPGGVLDLDGFFGLPPAMASLMPIYRAGRLAIVHAAGTPVRRDSHFLAQHALESGTPDRPDTRTGWLARCIEAAGPGERALALSAHLPISLFGSPRCGTLPRPLSGAAGASPLSHALDRAASLLSNDRTIRAVTIDSGGWDTHTRQDARSGAFAATLADLADSLCALDSDTIAAGGRPITVVVMSEFGRGIAENPAGGTDHGHGGVVLVIGQRINGGRVVARWPGLNSRRLGATIDTRDILAEIVGKALRIADIGSVFPGHQPTFCGLVREDQGRESG
jgi:uncharacterized protein (DUF1501 family)